MWDCMCCMLMCRLELVSLQEPSLVPCLLAMCMSTKKAQMVHMQSCELKGQNFAGRFCRSARWRNYRTIAAAFTAAERGALSCRVSLGHRMQECGVML